MLVSSMHVCEIQFFLTFSNLPLSPGQGDGGYEPYIPACPGTEITACLLAAMACQWEALLVTACGVAAMAATEADTVATEADTAATAADTAATAADTATITMDATEAAP